MLYNKKINIILILSFFSLQIAFFIDNANSQQRNVTNDLLNILLNNEMQANSLNKSSISSPINSNIIDQIISSIKNDSIIVTNNNIQTLILDGIRLPQGSILHLYDFYPNNLIRGQIQAKLPCPDGNNMPIDILVGNLSSMQKQNLSLIQNFTDSSNLCFYTAKISNKYLNIPINDIFIKNNSTDDIKFPATSSFILKIQSLD